MNSFIDGRGTVSNNRAPSMLNIAGLYIAGIGRTMLN